MTTNIAYMNKLAEVFGLQKMPESVRNALLEEIDVLVFRAVLFRVLSVLDDGDKDELHNILENAGDDFEKPYSFLKSKVKNLDEIIKEELNTVKQERLNIVGNFA